MHFFHDNLAVKIGLHEAIFLQNLYYLCKQNLLKERIEENSKISVTMSRTKILEYQEYFCQTKIRRMTKKLIDLNLMEVTKFKTNILSYSLTLKGWVTMFFLEKESELKKIETTSAQFSNTHLSDFTNHLLILTKGVSNLTDVLFKMTELVFKRTDIYIEDRNLIEINRKIEKMDSENLQNFLDEIDTIILENSILKKRIEKTFENIKNYQTQIIIPAIEKYGSLNVLKALKKTSEQFLPHNSPVGNFYWNLGELDII
ncbi:hypothetical protein [Candidatus Cetobacterium colombiensis]|uniref:Uncharacterized protein n=1 Tax=Candidatus Cetobacterium colombiensis TaxID=3073100 RepID=A0ABU4WCS8_9FUSO|nr:hypothetical protein [Candidatus Cetobacterium colombiensis]MDX8337338.1 hypothetical protein [Candidatus Cetobacterium colombiensis]